MKNTKFKFFLILILITSISISCSTTKRNTTAINYTYKTTCLGADGDGSYALEAWGKGRNFYESAEQAKINALKDVIFRGIKEGNGGCSRDPLILSASAEQVYEDYFSAFFSEKEKYSQYVTLTDQKKVNKTTETKKLQQRLVVVNVKRLALKKQLKLDNIK